MSREIDAQYDYEAGMSIELIVRAALGVVSREHGGPDQILISSQRSDLHFVWPAGIGAVVPNQELNRRKSLVKRVLKMREELPALGMTTADLVDLARTERMWLYER